MTARAGDVIARGMAGAGRAGARSEAPDIETRGYRLGRDLVLLSLVAVVVVRLFTEILGVLPRAANVVDLALLGALATHALVGLPSRARSARRPSFRWPVVAFVGIWAVSALANVSRVELGPALLFLIGFLEPIAFYYLAFTVWPAGQSLALSRTLVALGVLQFAVVVAVDLPRFFETRDPDLISGTFGENAYQLVFFLIVFATLTAGIATLEPRRLSARFAVPLIAGSFVVIFLAQYRSLLITTALVAVIVGLFVGAARGRGLFIAVVMVAGLILAFSFVAGRFPVTKFSPTLRTIREEPGLFLSAGKLQSVRDIGHLYADDPRFPLTGAGPGTYSSRAWRTFALIGDVGSHSDVAGPYISALRGGEAYRTDVSDRYVLPLWHSQNTILGSAALTQPFSSYLALLAEVGIPGFLLLVGVYAGATLRAGRMAWGAIRRRRPGDPVPALLLAATVALFVLLQMAFLENWLEVARVTIPAWILFAVGSKEYLAGREEDAARHA